MYIYIASPLCSEAERAFNIRVNDFILGLGFRTYLPQLNGGVMSDLVKQGYDEDVVRKKLFELDKDKMDECDALLLILDGRTIDEGACVELGYMYAKRKPCFGFKTDTRSFIRGKNNLMIDGCLDKINHSWNELKEYCLKLKGKL